MEHLREHWRQVTASKRTLYRGISLEGASRQYAWGLDEAIVRKFSSAMKKGDHQAAAKIVLDLCEQSGEFVEGGSFGVWWSTDHKVARGYAGMHTRTSLACVVHAEVDDDGINQGHAEQYGFTSEAPVVLRQGARVDIVAIEVRYNPDLKVLRDGDFVLIPVRRQVTATLKTADDLSVDGGDMRFYEWEGRQQKANGGGRKINSAGQAAELGNRVLADYGFDPSKVTWSMGTWESWTKDEGGGRIHINIGYGYSGDGAANAWTVLHEVAHAILFLRGNANHRHGADFEAVLLELIGKYTRVRGITPRTASSGAQIEAWVDPGYELARGGFSSSASAVARIGGQAIGFLYVDCVDRTGEVVKVWVDPDHRRKGVATEMLRAVERALGFKVSHGHELSQSGAAWASGESGRTYQPTYRGEGEFSYMIGQFDRLSPSKRTGAISLREGMETQFGEYRLVYTTKDEGETKPRHLVTAYLGSERVGNLEWYGRTGEVYEIVVRADHRRKGLATAMWEFAQDAPKKPKHSTQRTNDGEAWARTTGDSMPRRSHAALDYRTLVDALPSQYDQAIMSAMENAYDMGLREEAEDDGDAFWYQVYGEVMA